LDTQQKAMLFRKLGSISYKNAFLVFNGLKPFACGDWRAGGLTCP